jgi:predicted  nucleic acid-binding Zn-ribbon protein
MCAIDTLITLDMLETIEKLLILQDRDRNIRRVQGELAHIEPERQALKSRAGMVESQLENAKARIKQIESDRKALELEVEAKKELITRYANQQFQTRKNEEYRALAHEIDTCKQAIFQIEDQEIALMEQAETAQKEVSRTTQAAAETRKMVDEQVARLGAREQNLRKELESLQANREELASAVDESARGRYERLVRSKGENVVVGIQHGVCGGCHMRIPPQLLVMCQAKKELVTCSNCGRILYYTRDMDLAVAE